MRVVIVHNRYRSANPSGENRVVDADMSRLRSEGVEVIPFVRHSDEIEEFSPLGKILVGVRPVLSPSDVLRFRRLLRRARPDVVHLHNPFPLISPWVVRTAHAEGIPVVQTVHNFRQSCVAGVQFRNGAVCTDCVGRSLPLPAVRNRCYQGSTSASLSMAAAQVVHRGTWQLVDRFLAVGPGVVVHLTGAGIPAERIELWPNVLADPGPPEPPGSGVLFAGRLSSEKGIDLLLRAWEWSGLGASHTLTIAGDGPERRVVEEAAAADPSIRYVGFLDHRELGAAMCRSALAVVPSISAEADGITAASAMAHGRAVVVSNVGTMHDYVGGSCGWSTDPDPMQLANTLRAALADPVEVARRGAAGRARYLATRLPSEHRLTDLYDRLVAGRHSQLVGRDAGSVR